MNLREAIGEYAVCYAHCQEVIGMKGEGTERIRRQFGESVERLCRVVKVAEAALAYVEWQIDYVMYMPMDGATYMREREKLLDAFVVARDKVKEVNHEST